MRVLGAPLSSSTINFRFADRCSDCLPAAGIAQRVGRSLWTEFHVVEVTDGD